MLKLSRFTMYTTAGEHHYFFNSLSGASLILDNDEYAALYSVLNTATQESQLKSKEAIINLLMLSGLVVEAGTDELASALEQYDHGRHALEKLSLVITPTLSCNMSCFYCYQDRKNKGKLSTGDIDAIVRFAAERLQVNGSLNITWFGGEPLLEQEFIAATSQRLIALAESQRARYTAQVVSNCFNLDATAGTLLERCRVDRLQVTFDGPREKHDNVRRDFSKGTGAGEPSFSRIIENLHTAANRLAITARINVSELNIEQIPILIDELADADLQNKFAHIYFAPVFSHKTTSPLVSYARRPGVHLGIESFAQAEVALMRHAAARGFTLRNPFRPGYAGCIAVQENGFVVDANGEVKKCINDISRPLTAFTSIRQDAKGFNPEYTTKFELFRPEENSGCRECQLLPICYSACPQRQMLSEEERREKCPSHKYNWKDTLPILLAQQPEGQSCVFTPAIEDPSAL